jgi:hypothetical protein
VFEVFLLIFAGVLRYLAILRDCVPGRGYSILRLLYKLVLVSPPHARRWIVIHRGGFQRLKAHAAHPDF